MADAYTNLRDTPDKIAKLQTFHGNNMRGQFFGRGGARYSPDRGIGREAPPQGSIYVVWSYATPIAWIDNVGRAHRVPEKFSVSTSKHQGKLYTLRDLTPEEQRELCGPSIVITEEQELFA